MDGTWALDKFSPNRDKSVVVYVARSHRSRVGVSGRSLFFFSLRAYRGIRPPGQV